MATSRKSSSRNPKKTTPSKKRTKKTSAAKSKASAVLAAAKDSVPDTDAAEDAVILGEAPAETSGTVVASDADATVTETVSDTVEAAYEDTNPFDGSDDAIASDVADAKTEVADAVEASQDTTSDQSTYSDDSSAAQDADVTAGASGSGDNGGSGSDAPAGAAHQPPAESSGSGFLPLLLGGAIAAALGFGAALFAFPNGVFGDKSLSEDVAAIGENLSGIETRVDEASTRLETVEAGQSTLNDTVGALQTDHGSLGTTQQEITATQETLRADFAALQTEYETLSQRLIDAADGDTNALSEAIAMTLQEQKQVLADALEEQKAEMARVQGELDKMTAFAASQIEAAEAEAAEAEQAELRVKARGALNVVRDALASGDPFADALPDISAAVDVPDTIAAVAEDGVATTGALQSTFTNAAREALSQSVRETAGSGAGDKLKLFFQDQFGARSLAPREGDDPDAVLSRAEAALRDGNIDSTLETITALPESGQAALAEWSGMAQARQAALDGFKTLSDALSGN